MSQQEEQHHQQQQHQQHQQQLLNLKTAMLTVKIELQQKEILYFYL